MTPNPEVTSAASTAAASPAAAAAPAPAASPASPAAAPSSSAAASAATSGDDAGDGGGTAAEGTKAGDGAPAAGETPPWSPNFKFKFAKVDNPDEQEEAEVDEWIRDSIKDPETEKKARELFERARGIDSVKGRLVKEREEKTEIKAAFGRNLQGQRELGSLLTKGKFGEFFDLVKVPRQKVYEWMLEEAKYHELPPEEKARVDAQRTAEREAETSRSTAMDYEHRFHEQSARVRTIELKTELQKPDVSEFASRYDETVGKAGAFMDEVVLLGQWAWKNQEVDLPVEEVVKQVMAKYGRFLGAPASAAAGSAAPGAGQPNGAAPSAPRSVPVIPKVPGGGTQSPTKSPKSFDELKRLSKEAEARIAARS